MIPINNVFANRSGHLWRFTFMNQFYCSTRHYQNPIQWVDLLFVECAADLFQEIWKITCLDLTHKMQGFICYAKIG
ncbi:hypothetical protein BLOT_009258 [Blomia tropicalis]|nr:hypothetical protein BLOT_009258 [Blomia tropicalis]